MKNINTILAAALLVSTSFVSLANDNKPVKDGGANAEIKVTFAPAEKNTLMVFFGNEAKERVRIQITDTDGKRVYNKSVKADKFGGKYIFSEVEKGNYTVTVSNEAGIISSREITVQ